MDAIVFVLSFGARIRVRPRPRKYVIRFDFAIISPSTFAVSVRTDRAGWRSVGKYRIFFARVGIPNIRPSYRPRCRNYYKFYRASGVPLYPGYDYYAYRRKRVWRSVLLLAVGYARIVFSSDFRNEIDYIRVTFILRSRIFAITHNRTIGSSFIRTVRRGDD